MWKSEVEEDLLDILAVVVEDEEEWAVLCECVYHVVYPLCESLLGYSLALAKAKVL